MGVLELMVMMAMMIFVIVMVMVMMLVMVMVIGTKVIRTLTHLPSSKELHDIGVV
jgi:hypothetical protein